MPSELIRERIKGRGSTREGDQEDDGREDTFVLPLALFAVVDLYKEEEWKERKREREERWKRK